MYRQGDVLVEKIVKMPHGESTQERLLVSGEGRNHGHFVIGDAVSIVKAPDGTTCDGGGIVTHYLDIGESVTLEHLLIDSMQWTSEHAPITLPPGKYRVLRQREYNPYAKAIRAIKD